MAIVPNPFLRTFLFSLGVIALVLGAVGAFLPLLPTTPFVLLATWCFLKSSPKAHDWIYHRSIFGPIIKDWEEKQRIKKPVKLLACTMMLASIALLWVKVDVLWLKALVTLGLSVVMLFIVTRKS